MRDIRRLVKTPESGKQLGVLQIDIAYVPCDTTQKQAKMKRQKMRARQHNDSCIDVWIYVFMNV